MNERIEALKKLATKEVWGNNPYNGSPEYYGYELDADMFAQLIVRECINQAHSVGDLRGANDDMIYGADTAAVKISKHFGVEE